MPRSDRKIQLSGPARQDLAEIRAYTQREWGEKKRKAYLADIKAKFSLLCAAPEMGVDRGYLKPGLRSHPAGSHVIYYRDTEEGLRVVRVLHHSRDAERHLSSWENRPSKRETAKPSKRARPSKRVAIAGEIG